MRVRGRYTEFVGVNGTLLRSATLGRQWMMQMGRAAHQHNLGLQLCMVSVLRWTLPSAQVVAQSCMPAPMCIQLQLQRVHPGSRC